MHTHAATAPTLRAGEAVVLQVSNTCAEARGTSRRRQKKKKKLSCARACACARTGGRSLPPSHLCGKVAAAAAQGEEREAQAKKRLWHAGWGWLGLMLYSIELFILGSRPFCPFGRLFSLLWAGGLSPFTVGRWKDLRPCTFLPPGDGATCGRSEIWIYEDLHWIKSKRRDLCGVGGGRRGGKADGAGGGGVAFCR